MVKDLQNIGTVKHGPITEIRNMYYAPTYVGEGQPNKSEGCRQWKVGIYKAQYTYTSYTMVRGRTRTLARYTYSSEFTKLQRELQKEAERLYYYDVGKSLVEWGLGPVGTLSELIGDAAETKQFYKEQSIPEELRTRVKFERVPLKQIAVMIENGDGTMSFKDEQRQMLTAHLYDFRIAPSSPRKGYLDSRTRNWSDAERVSIRENRRLVQEEVQAGRFKLVDFTLHSPEPQVDFPIPDFTGVDLN